MPVGIASLFVVIGVMVSSYVMINFRHINTSDVGMNYVGLLLFGIFSINIGMVEFYVSLLKNFNLMYETFELALSADTVILIVMLFSISSLQTLILYIVRYK